VADSLAVCIVYLDEMIRRLSFLSTVPRPLVATRPVFMYLSPALLTWPFEDPETTVACTPVY